MAKAFAIVLGLAMLAHLIRPFGLPGFRRRADAWKLALVGIAILLLTAVIRPE